jgi:hypothetical protein
MKDVKTKKPFIWMHPPSKCIKKYLKVTTDEDHDLGILAAYLNGRDGIFLFRHAATLSVTVNVTERCILPALPQSSGMLVVETSMAGECIWKKTFDKTRTLSVAYVRNLMHDDLKAAGRITAATIIKFVQNDVALLGVVRLWSAFPSLRPRRAAPY